VMCGSIITRCWYLEVTSAQEIYDSIKCLVWIIILPVAPSLINANTWQD
jgi:hypothetical protein